ncbi:transglutaminase family protein [Planctomonas psychrotolerans]|uniref:transglutaminase family protein n=1 Tax=Planctomonas psychrotolerans TaxID=2528712 RepID=UPI00123A5910|nr:DUF3488 and transglutaminase-like domain-containing protein [Planctomonas psychrotolerans]
MSATVRMAWPVALRERPRGAPVPWRLSGAVALCVLASLLALAPVIRPGAWMIVNGAVVVAVLGILAVLRRRGVAGPVAFAGAGFTGGAVLVLAYAGDGMALGLIPTGDTVALIDALVTEGIGAIRSGSAPVDAPAGLSLLLGVGAVLLALLLHAVAISARMPALAGIPLLIVIALPSVLVPDGFSVPAFALGAGVFTLLLRVGSLPATAAPARVRSGTRALAVGAATVTGAVLLPPLLPPSSFVLAGPYGSGGVGAAPAGTIAANPIVALGDDLRQPAAQPALSYTTTDTDPGYLRMAVLTDFDPSTWVPSAFRLNRSRTVDEIAKPPGLTSAIDTAQTVTDIEITGAYSRWLPAPYPARSITGLQGDWFWEPDALAVRATDSTTRGQRYRVEGIDVRPTREDLVSAGPVDGSAFLPELRVPEGQVPAVVSDTAREVTAGLTSDYDRAVALQNFLRSERFVYSESAPLDGGYDGSGPEIIARFLTERSGYCVHFASAMALMARAVGIPARIGVGYTAGDPVRGALGRAAEEEGASAWEVDTRDAHAWPELYFDRVGWVPFEPTPGRGRLPAYAAPVVTASPQRPAEPAPDASAPAAVPQELAEEAAAVPGTEGGNAPGGAPIGILALMVVALVLAPAMVRIVRRGSRLDRLRAGRGTATDAWRELSDAALDYRVAVPATDTPREFGDRVAAGLGPGGSDAVARLRTAFERESFARPVGDEPLPLPAEQGAALADACRTVLANLDAAAPAADRARARLLPLSLLSSRKRFSHAT